jgi:UDP-2,4-diacetamido-2,4,6-trideoxy-beta-L-altropyranose hydrolase
VRRVLCRVDAGPNTGLGHLQRCLSLAEAFRRQGLAVVFLVPEVGDVPARVQGGGFELLGRDHGKCFAGGGGDRDMVVDAARLQACDLVVLDSYHIDNEYIADVRRAGLVTIVIDDLAAEPFAAHLVVNGAAGTDRLAYTSSTGDTQFLLGPQYALLHTAFWGAPKRVLSPKVNHILVSVGGADPGRALPRILRSIDGLSDSFTITAVVGPFAFDDPDPAPEQYDHPVSFIRAAHHLRQLMYDADVAVSASGQTLYELAATGTPAVAVQLFENQATNVRGLAAEGAVVDGGNASDADFNVRLGRSVAELIGDGRKRDRLSHRGQALIDGLGATRVAAAALRLA